MKFEYSSIYISKLYDSKNEQYSSLIESTTELSQLLVNNLKVQFLLTDFFQER